MIHLFSKRIFLMGAVMLSAALVADAALPNGLPTIDRKEKETVDRQPDAPKVPTKKGKSRRKAREESKTLAKPYFSIDKTTSSARGAGGHDYIPVEARNTTWEISQYPASWATVTKSGNDGIDIEYAENPSSQPRFSRMYVTNGSKVEVIQLTQTGTVKFEVVDIAFANTDESGNKIYSDFGAPLYTYDLNYLLPRVTYNGPEETEDKIVGVRIVKPDGSVDGIEDPNDFTYQWVIKAQPGKDQTADLYTWGDNVRRRGVPYYFPGTYSFQLWVDDELAISKEFKVSLKPDDYGATIEDYWVEHNINYEGQDGMLVHSRVNSQNLEGYKICYCIFLKDEEGNPLRDERDRILTVQDMADVESNDFYWDNWSVFVPYDTIRKALGDSKTFTYKIEVQNFEAQRPLSNVTGLSHTFTD
ncbi:MAG: BACON domain-containing protein [Paramuribaculum sp.]